MSKKIPPMEKLGVAIKIDSTGVESMVEVCLDKPVFLFFILSIR
ncbi:MAG TPA: hypothetical protein VMD74_01725 [Candidatus Methylomirabilis sp.]|nr:hypothetical protein [Candidatus Methylomirabilis sp.]